VAAIRDGGRGPRHGGGRAARLSSWCSLTPRRPWLSSLRPVRLAVNGKNNRMEKDWSRQRATTRPARESSGVAREQFLRELDARC